MRLAEATKDSGYTEDARGAVRESVRLYADLEADAAAMSDYHCELVPGLLQTEDYIRAIMLGAESLPTDVVDQRVAFRSERQRAFFGRPRPGRMDAVITAGALHLEVGSAPVMEARCEHLRALADEDGVSIRILPADDGLRPTMSGPFSILDFDDPDDRPSPGSRTSSRSATSTGPSTWRGSGRSSRRCGARPSRWRTT